MKILVTGGGGFVGGAIVRQLRGRGDEVRTFSRGDYPELGALGAEVVRGDLSDAEAVARAVRGCDAVIHVAARPGVWGSWDSFYRPNVVGTENVIRACRDSGVSRLVYTSSPSAVHGGGSIEGADESLPYPEHFDAHYPATKAMAERLVLAANDEVLSTVALRPHLVWGPGDNHLLPRMVQRSRAGKLALIGDGSQLVDTTWVEDAATAHLLALDKVSPGAACAGRAYFLSQGEPWPLKDMMNGLLEAAGAPRVERCVPRWAAYTVGALLEGTYWLLRRTSEPPMTRWLAGQLGTSHWYDISAARRDLGYEPSVTIAEGLERLSEALSQSS